MYEQQCSEKLEEVCGEVELAECREEQVTFSTEQQDTYIEDGFFCPGRTWR